MTEASVVPEKPEAATSEGVEETKPARRPGRPKGSTNRGAGKPAATRKARKAKRPKKRVAKKPKKPVKPNLGQLLDGIWTRLADDHPLRAMEPLKLPSPHQNLRAFGRAIIKVCEEHLEHKIEVEVEGYDRDTWERLIGAWALFQRTNRITRCEAAKQLGMDRSNLTIALNGKRPLTQSVLMSLAKMLNVEPFDIRSDLGASYARSKDRDVAIMLNKISHGISSMKGEVLELISSGLPLDGLLSRIEKLDAELGVH